MGHGEVDLLRTLAEVGGIPNGASAPRGPAELINAHPPEVRAWLRYLSVLTLIDDHKACSLGTQTQDGRTYLRIQTQAGKEFEIERPAPSSEIEALRLSQVRDILDVAGEE